MTLYATEEWARIKDLRWPFLRRADIRSGLKVTVQPTAEPIDLATARQHLKLATSGSPASNPDDTLITDIYLPAAREACENYCGRALAPQTLAYAIDRFPENPWEENSITLPMEPLIGVSSVAYVDTAGATQTLGTTIYDVDTYSSRITLADSQSWPATLTHPNAVVITYSAGYSLPTDSPQDSHMPASVRAAILLTLSTVYDRCQDNTICDITDLPAAAKYLLDPYRVRKGFA